MTRRDYLLLAECFASSLSVPGILFLERQGIARAAKHMANVLAIENARFERHLFLRNCGLVHAERDEDIAQGYGGNS